MAKNSRWKRVIKKLSTYQVGNYVTKRSMCRDLHSFKDHNKDLVGTYLHFLYKMGFLELIGNNSYLVSEQIPISLTLKEVNEWIHRYNNPPSELKEDSMKVMFYHLNLMEDLQKLKGGRKCYKEKI